MLLMNYVDILNNKPVATAVIPITTAMSVASHANLADDSQLICVLFGFLCICSGR